MAIAEVNPPNQRNTVALAGGTTTNLAFLNDVAADSLIVVGGACWCLSTVGSMTVAKVSGGATLAVGFTTILGTTGLVWSGGVGLAWIAYAIVGTAGSLTMSITSDRADTYFNASCDEFSGVQSTPLDVNGGEAVLSSSTTPTDSITTVTANDLIIGVAAFGGNPTAITPGSGYTTIDDDTPTSVSPYSHEFRIVTTAGAYNVNWTVTTAQTSDVTNAAFKPLAVTSIPRILTSPIRRAIGRV